MPPYGALLSLFRMLWRNEIPLIKIGTPNKEARIKLIAGKFNDYIALEPNPDSWAYDLNNGVKIMLIEIDAESEIFLEGGKKSLFQMLYAFDANNYLIDQDEYIGEKIFKLVDKKNIKLKGIIGTSKFLLVEGMPINEPVYAYGPFVMNTEEAVLQAYKDFRDYQFGGWPFDKTDPVHGKETGRFAKFPDGRIELPK